MNMMLKKIPSFVLCLFPVLIVNCMAIILDYSSMVSDIIIIDSLIKIVFVIFSSVYLLLKLEKYYKINKWYLFFVSIAFSVVQIFINIKQIELSNVMYMSLLLILTAFMFDIANNSIWFKKKFNIFKFLLVAISICTLSSTGIILILCVFITLIIKLKFKRRLVVMCVILFSMYFLISTIGTSYMGSKFITKENKYNLVTYTLARMLDNSEVSFSDDELTNISQFVDIESLKQSDTNNYNYNLNLDNYNLDMLNKHGSEYSKLVVDKFLSYPKEVIMYHVKLVGLMYNPFFLTQSKEQVNYINFIIVWTSMFAIICIIISYILKRRYNDKNITLIILPLISNILSYILLLAEDINVYIYPSVEIFFLLLSWLFYSTFMSHNKGSVIRDTFVNSELY